MQRSELKELGSRLIQELKNIAEANINEVEALRALALKDLPAASFGNDWWAERFYFRLCILAIEAKIFRAGFEGRPLSEEQNMLKSRCKVFERALEEL
jgi:hypothetical protein